MYENLSGIVNYDFYTSTEYYPGTSFEYRIHIPECCKGKRNVGLILNYDGALDDAEAAEYLEKTGEMPPCVSIALKPGELLFSRRGGFDRGLRMNNYDLVTDTYANFVVDEFIPHVIKKYDLSISENPDMHMTCGGSSAGISAWTVAWYRNDYFRRVYASSPTFSAMSGGEGETHLIRKFEPKPMRVFTDYSENEPDSFFGSSFTAADNFVRALKYAGYDCKCEYHQGEGHCSRLHDRDYAIYRLIWLWKDWQTVPVGIGGYSDKVSTIVTPESKWNKAEYSFSSHRSVVTENGEYKAEGGKISLTRGDGTVVTLTEDFRDITAIALSSDNMRMYIGDRSRRCIYAATVTPDGTFEGIYVLGALHVSTDFRDPGVFDMCVDTWDRLYIATELGIQTMRSFGLIDVILHNPDGNTVANIALGDDSVLYAATASGTYGRPLMDKHPTSPDTATEPKQTSYYDR